MPEQPLNILLIEDNPDHAELIRMHLRRDRDAAVTVEWSERLDEGLAQLTRSRVDAVLLDMMLPDCTGVETVSRVHSHAPDVPIVVLTSADGDQYGLEAVQHGADDYIFKGRMDSHNLIRSVRYAIERCGRRQAETALAGARQELRIAQKIQQSLYPVNPPPAPGLDIAGVSYPAESVGGDYFDYIPMLDGHLGLAVGDVSGHGIGPALLMAEARAALRTLTRTYRSVGEVLTLANRILLDGMLEGRFVTLMLASLDPHRRSLIYCGAGHPDGLLFDEQGNIASRLESTGYPLGVVSDEEYSASAPVQLRPGHTLLLVTDGIAEASTPGPARPFGLERITAVVRENRQLPASQIIRALHDAVLKHARPGVPLDDVTAVVMKVLPG